MPRWPNIALSVYKPRGLTPYGQRKQDEQHEVSRPIPLRRRTAATPRWVSVLGILVIVLVLLFVILHLTGRGLGGH